MRRAFSTKAVSALSPPARNVCTSGETADDALDGDVLTARTTARLGLVTPVFVRSFRRDMVVRGAKRVQQFSTAKAELAHEPSGGDGIQRGGPS